MAYKSYFSPVNPDKCINSRRGEPIVCRSTWERCLAKWCDKNEEVTHWGSEVITVPYRSRLDQKIHTYYVDFIIRMKDGKVLLVEVKPEKETKKPEPSKKRKSKKYKYAIVNYVRNISKWEAATQYAEKRGWLFEIYTEKTLRKMGLPVI